MRSALRAWLGEQEPVSGDASSAQDEEALVRHFLQRVSAAGFVCHIQDIPRDGGTGYEVRWTHHGSSFVGFKQARLQDSPAHALLAGCAALLENEWCRSRLGGVIGNE